MWLSIIFVAYFDGNVLFCFLCVNVVVRSGVVTVVALSFIQGVRQGKKKKSEKERERGRTRETTDDDRRVVVELFFTKNIARGRNKRGGVFSSIDLL